MLLNIEKSSTVELDLLLQADMVTATIKSIKGDKMTLQQLKYIILIAEVGSLNRASEQAYIAQPSLSSSLRELENEIGIELFTRTNRGLKITSEGQEFLSYARQVVEQYSLIEDKYIHKTPQKEKFCVSTQHYSFAIKAFINTVKQFEMNEYEYAIRETKTHEVIDDVRQLRSEIGILYLNEFNHSLFTKMFKDYGLVFQKLFACKIYVYLAKEHPLGQETEIAFSDLEHYPCLSFDQGEQNSFYFAEEVMSVQTYEKLIKTNDRATMLNLMRGLDAYTLCSGIISEDLNGDGYTAIPLLSNETMDIGYIIKKGQCMSRLAETYIAEIFKIYEKYQKL